MAIIQLTPNHFNDQSYCVTKISGLNLEGFHSARWNTAGPLKTQGIFILISPICPHNNELKPSFCGKGGDMQYVYFVF